MIKSVTTKYDSPNVAYHCGEAYPWSYNNQWTSDYNDMVYKMPYQCLKQPDTCAAENYYQNTKNYQFDVDSYTQNGKWFNLLFCSIIFLFRFQQVTLQVQLILVIHFTHIC